MFLPSILALKKQPAVRLRALCASTVSGTPRRQASRQRLQKALCLVVFDRSAPADRVLGTALWFAPRACTGVTLSAERAVSCGQGTSLATTALPLSQDLQRQLAVGTHVTSFLGSLFSQRALYLTPNPRATAICFLLLKNKNKSLLGPHTRSRCVHPGWMHPCFKLGTDYITGSF